MSSQFFATHKNLSWFLLSNKLVGVLQLIQISSQYCVVAAITSLFFTQIYYQSGLDTTIKNIDTTDIVTTFNITGLMPSTKYSIPCIRLPLLEQEKEILVSASET